jgi:hypothetical protein
MLWTLHLIEFKDELLKTKISSQEGTDISNEWGEVKKEESLEGQYKMMGQGKSSPVLIVAK